MKASGIPSRLQRHRIAQLTCSTKCLHRHDLSQDFSRLNLSSRPFSASAGSQAEETTLEPINAAPEIDIDSNGQASSISITHNTLKKVRIVPASSSYFTAKPNFTDNILGLRSLLAQYQHLPVSERGEAPIRKWINHKQYQRSAGAEPVKSSSYGTMSKILKRLNYIHPLLMPNEVFEALNKYSQLRAPSGNTTKPIILDEFGRAKAVGRRKESSAKVYLVEGEGDILINGKSLTQSFARIHDRESVIWPLKATQRTDKYNVWALVNGGGTTGQAEALTLGIAKALIAHEPLLKTALRKGKSSHHHHIQTLIAYKQLDVFIVILAWSRERNQDELKLAKCLLGSNGRLCYF